MDNKSFDQQLPVYEHYSRSMGYIAVAAVLVAGYLSGVLQAYTPLLVVFVLTYPHVIHAISTRFLENKHKQRRFLLILIDATLIGVLLPYMHFALLPSILFMIMINTSFLVVGSLTGWLICLLATCIGILLGSWMFGMDFMYEVPIQVSITAALGVGVHLAVTGYYSHKQAKQLAVLHHELKKQQTESRNLSLKVAKYISPQIWESIFSGKKEVKLETQRKKLVIFFSDIKGFTSLSEELDADVLTEMLNHYLTEMSRITLKYGGTIDKFIGDSIMVFFGDPTTQGAKRDALACVAMALEMRKYMKVLRQHWRSNGIQTPLEIRMGINTGYCTVGNFGTESRMDYTIIGREVNMASRLESAAESGEILISHETFSLVQDKIMCREKGSITVKGFSRPVPVYQVVDFRHNLAANPSFLEHELPGFSMYLDATKITNYDREKVVKMLENAATKLKDKSRLIL